MAAVAATYYPSLAVGDLVTADLLQSMVPKYYIKASVESRNTTTTLANDSDLVSIALAVGTYEIELLGFFTLSTTTAQKIKTQWAFTGTWSAPVRSIVGPGSAQVALTTDATETNLRASATNVDATYDASTSTAFSCFREWTSNAVVTVAGNLSLQWAQSASSGNNTNLQAGTAFRVRQIG